MLNSLLLALATALDGGGIPPPVVPGADAPMAIAPAGSSGAPAARPVPVITGGYSRLSPRARELRPVLAAALARLTPSRNARARIVQAEQQVVAGTNYRLLVKLRDGSRWRVVVWQRLDGGYEVTESARES